MLEALHWPFLLAALPLCIYATWSDLKHMIIPNWLCLGLLGAFVLLGLFLMPIAALGWQLLAGLGVLVFTFVLNAAGKMGGGDAKMLAALAPYIAFERAPLFFMIFAACLMLALLVHRVARAIPVVRRATPDWVSWESAHFPMGTGISAALLIYLSIMVFLGKPSLNQLLFS